MNPDLPKLAAILENWSKETTFIIYLYGSRVREDHRIDSDVDIMIHKGQATDTDVDWWGEQNDEEFATVNEHLPGPIEILHGNPSLEEKIFEAASKPIHRIGNVICVWLPPKNT